MNYVELSDLRDGALNLSLGNLDLIALGANKAFMERGACNLSTFAYLEASRSNLVRLGAWFVRRNSLGLFSPPL